LGDNLLFLDAKILFFLRLSGFPPEFVVAIGVVACFSFLENLLKRTVVVLQRVESSVLSLGHGWDGLQWSLGPEQVAQVLRHFLLGHVPLQTVVLKV